MTSNQPKNAALTTALAFHYQTLIGIEKCFSLQVGQSIWFEKDGDVSLQDINPKQSTQTEVKHYAAPLTDHHENLWKALKNWLDPNFNHSAYGALVLHTTQAFGATTRLKDWNTQTATQRLEILKKIYSERTEEELNAEKPSEIIKLQKAVMNTDQQHLLDVIAKVTLFTEADDLNALEKALLAKLVGIPKSNLKRYLQGLVGFVYDQADQKSWSIQYKNFGAKCEELTALFCKREFTFPSFTGSAASALDVEQHQDKLFVQKINEIKHDTVIPDAVGNWMELQNSLFEELDEYPIYAKKTRSYQEQIVKRFKLDYSSAQLASIDQIINSKLLYNKTIAEPPLNLGNDTPPIEYKNGLIHDAMDDETRDLKWRVEP